MSNERFIAYFDLLGFKNFVRNQNLETVVKLFDSFFNSLFAAMIRHSVKTGVPIEEFTDRYSDLEHNDAQPLILEKFEKETGFTPLLLSDTLVLYSKPIEMDTKAFHENMIFVVLASRIIISRLFRQGLPARGAITWGEFHADHERNIYCGKALVEVSEIAEDQEWIGAVVCQSIEDKLKPLLDSFSIEKYATGIEKISFNMIRPGWDVLLYDVPFKSGVKKSMIINWASEWNAGGPVRDDYFLEKMTGKENIDRKYSNTLSFLKNWKDNWPDE